MVPVHTRRPLIWAECFIERIKGSSYETLKCKSGPLRATDLVLTTEKHCLIGASFKREKEALHFPHYRATQIT